VTDEFFMKEALKEAQKALRYGDVPVGAVITQNGTIIARAHNQVERLKDPTAHAEMIAITQATEQLKDERLRNNVTLYVTLEPCAMCAGALVWARVKRLCYGARDPKAGACGSLYNIVKDDRLNHRLEVVEGIMEADSRAVLQDFFKQLRKDRR